MQNSKYLTKPQASMYLTDTLGMPVAEKTLSKLITNGGGPKYRKWGKRVLYSIADLNTWANSKLSAPMTNSGHGVQ